MPRSNTRSVAWVVYDWDSGPYAISIHASAEDAVRATAAAGYGRIAKWPFGTELRDAITEWEKPPARPDLLPDPGKPLNL